MTDFSRIGQLPSKPSQKNRAQEFVDQCQMKLSFVERQYPDKRFNVTVIAGLTSIDLLRMSALPSENLLIQGNINASTFGMVIVPIEQVSFIITEARKTEPPAPKREIGFHTDTASF